MGDEILCIITVEKFMKKQYNEIVNQVTVVGSSERGENYAEINTRND